MKNLNYAVPIDEFKNLSTKEAEFFEKEIKIKEGAKGISKSFEFKEALPSDINNLMFCF